MRPSILVIQNAQWEGPGLIAVHARAAGLNLVTAELFRKTRNAKAIPFDQLEKGAYSCVVALGSSATAYRPETNPHHEELVQMFRQIRRQKLPSFNICYSMQLFSIAHGGKVVKSKAGKEVGFRLVRPTPEGKSDRVFGPIGQHSALQWHGDIV
jgi:GMP synthase-like glutamine amidotransferase